MATYRRAWAGRRRQSLVKGCSASQAAQARPASCRAAGHRSCLGRGAGGEALPPACGRGRPGCTSSWPADRPPAPVGVPWAGVAGRHAGGRCGSAASGTHTATGWQTGAAGAAGQWAASSPKSHRAGSRPPASWATTSQPRSRASSTACSARRRSRRRRCGVHGDGAPAGGPEGAATGAGAPRGGPSSSRPCRRAACTMARSARCQLRALRPKAPAGGEGGRCTG